MKVLCTYCRGTGLQVDRQYDPRALEPWECDECEGTGWMPARPAPAGVEGDVDALSRAALTPWPPREAA